MPSILNQIFYNHNNKFGACMSTAEQGVGERLNSVEAAKEFDKISSIALFDDFMFTVTNKQKIMQSYSDIEATIAVKCSNYVAPDAKLSRPTEFSKHSCTVATMQTPSTMLRHVVASTEFSRSPTMLRSNISGSLQIVQIVQSHIFYPEKEDSLFWCMYIAVNGHDEYMLIDKRYSNIELSEKQKMITTIRERPKQLKQSNFKVTNVMIQEILSDLMVQKKSSLSTLLSMVIYYKRPVYIVCKNTYLYFCDTTEQSDHDTIILNRNINGEYGIDLSSNEEILKTVEHIKSTHFQLDHFVKPLKGVSTYKTNELHDIAKKLGLVESDYVKLKKGELYNKLNDECTWI